MGSFSLKKVLPLRTRLQFLTFCLVVCILLVIALVVSTLVGSVNIDAAIIGKIIVNKLAQGEIFEPAWEKNVESIVWTLRLPRIILAFAVGAGLSLCGILMQALTKNSLADPYVLGISSGASAGAVCAILFGWFSFAGHYGVMCGATVGALLALLISMKVATIDNRITPTQLVLAGIIVSPQELSIGVATLSSRESAKLMSVMVQEHNVEFDMDVLEMVLLGRYAHKKFLSSTTDEDRQIAAAALKAVGMEGFDGRSFISLSGGEKQRVLIARALTQQANFIILDEPTNHLDVGYQYQVMEILKKQNITVFSSIHDLCLAAYYCDKIIVMDQGRLISYGPPEQVLTKELIEQLFGIAAEVSKNQRTGKIQLFFYPPV